MHLCSLFCFEAKLAEIEKWNLELNEREADLHIRENKVKETVIIHKKKYEEIAGEMKKIHTRKNCMEAFSKYLVTGRKELDEGFKKLNSEKTEFAGFKNSVAGKCLHPISLFFLT